MESIEEHKISAQDEQNEDECYASTEEYFLDCCRYGDLQDVIDTIKEGVDINYFDNNLNSCLHMAAANGHIEIIKELLKVKTDDKLVLNINAKNSDGSTPLHWAVINDKKDVIELLIENGADCNIKSKYGHTPLDEAILGGRYEIAEILAAKTKPDEEELSVLEEDVNENNGEDEDIEEEDEDENEEKMSNS